MSDTCMISLVPFWVNTKESIIFFDQNMWQSHSNSKNQGTPQAYRDAITCCDIGFDAMETRSIGHAIKSKHMAIALLHTPQSWTSGQGHLRHFNCNKTKITIDINWHNFQHKLQFLRNSVFLCVFVRQNQAMIHPGVHRQQRSRGAPKEAKTPRVTMSPPLRPSKLSWATWHVVTWILEHLGTKMN